jgi:hypothetical protein
MSRQISLLHIFTNGDPVLAQSFRHAKMARIFPTQIKQFVFRVIGATYQELVFA